MVRVPSLPLCLAVCLFFYVCLSVCLFSCCCFSVCLSVSLYCFMPVALHIYLSISCISFHVSLSVSSCPSLFSSFHPIPSSPDPFVPILSSSLSVLISSSRQTDTPTDKLTDTPTDRETTSSLHHPMIHPANNYPQEDKPEGKKQNLTHVIKSVPFSLSLTSLLLSVLPLLTSSSFPPVPLPILYLSVLLFYLPFSSLLLLPPFFYPPFRYLLRVPSIFSLSFFSCHVPFPFPLLYLLLSSFLPTYPFYSPLSHPFP